MKLNELKEPLNEKGLASWFGDYGKAVGQKMGSSLSGNDRFGDVEQNQIRNTFISKFIAKATNALGDAIEGGIVDPNLKDQPAATVAPAAAPTTEPAQPSAAKTFKSSGVTSKTPTTGQRQTSQNINNYVKSIAANLNAEPNKEKKMALAKELVNFMADRKDYPEWQNALVAAQQIIKKGIPDPNFSNSAINRLKAGQMMEAWQIYWINKLLESIGFTFKDLGLTLLKENKKNGLYVLAETKYYKLNKLFESIVTEAKQSISQYIQSWAKKFLTGVNLTGFEDEIKELSDAVQNSYAQDGGKAALQKFALSAYAMSNQDGNQAGPKPQAATSQAPANQTAQATQASPQKTGTSTDTIINNVQSLLAKLKGIDPALHSQVIKKIASGQSLQMPDNTQSEPAQTKTRPVDPNIAQSSPKTVNNPVTAEGRKVRR